MIRRLVKGRDGSTAVEFAMVALPFLALICGIIELGFVFLVSTTLETATTDTARQIRTGEMQTAGGATAATFKQSVCNGMSWLGVAQCMSNLQVDVRTFAQFQNTAVPAPIVNGQLNTQSLLFQMGGPGDIVLVRVYYPWTLMTPNLDGAVQNLSGGQHLISAAATFRNEPYPTTP
ncbi:MAG: pilus assembly protein [Caulobacteraceae bacterium]|nr:pilus assembly protein [Caulobacteraceae bacterium]